MACFLVPLAEAIVTTIVEKVVEKKEEKKEDMQLEGKILWSKKLGWLNKMLWGGSALLAFEHVWHGEVTPFYPFLTAMDNPNDMAAMFHEMVTVGVSMALLVTLTWGIMIAVVSQMTRKKVRGEME